MTYHVTSLKLGMKLLRMPRMINEPTTDQTRGLAWNRLYLAIRIPTSRCSQILTPLIPIPSFLSQKNVNIATEQDRGGDRMFIWNRSSDSYRYVEMRTGER